MNKLIFFLVRYFFLIKSFGKIIISCFQMISYYNLKFDQIKLKFDECLVQKLYFFFKHQICNKKQFMKRIYQLFITKKDFVVEFSVKKFFGLFYLPNFQQISTFKDTTKNLSIKIVSLFFLFFFFREKNKYTFFFKKISNFCVLIEKYIETCHLKFRVNQKNFFFLCEFVYFFFHKNINVLIEYMKYLKCQKYFTNNIVYNLKYSLFFNLTQNKKCYKHFTIIPFSKVKQNVNRKIFLSISKYRLFLYANKSVSIYRLFEIGIELRILWFNLQLCGIAFFTSKDIFSDSNIFFLLKKKIPKFENRFFNFFFYFKQKMLILKKNNSILKKISLEKSLNKRKFQMKLYEIKNMETDFIEILNKINT
ncbi:hypothetical protein CPARA_3gp436 (nucleomorph) [Cryptomonas paramecium]|uniref:Uncharacterized protein n=1 Tax=Cryptomonas paramaecium TaxID=2898 RepID=F2HIH0_9CRYP|nr:hypothetical protein CPARA_3gp436 [Cryptomonas paramecium]AEA39094.1 hypothetical protein CPARA_3gp436 [Cryptomonas paramecium]